MAELNLLKAGYQGKLGETNAYEHKGKFIVRATPFSRSPLNEQQKANFNAFTKLNRVSSFLAKNCFQVFNIKNYPAYKHNAIASLLKPALNNGNFDLSKIINIEKTFTTNWDIQVSRDYYGQFFQANCSIQNYDVAGKQIKCVTTVFDKNFKSLIYQENNNTSFTVKLRFNNIKVPILNFLTFSYYEEGGRYMKSNFCIKNFDISEI